MRKTDAVAILSKFGGKGEEVGCAEEESQGEEAVGGGCPFFLWRRWR